MKPFVNLAQLDGYEHSDDGPFEESYATISDKIGAQKLGYSVSIVPPGKKANPFHNHRINEEMFLVLEGCGTLRFGDEEYAIKQHDIIACPPGDRDVAHQIINTSDADIKYLCLSTQEPYDICEYPDSNKVLSYVISPDKPTFRHITKADDTVDYYDGEQ